jgi:hypothetical protein
VAVATQLRYNYSSSAAAAAAVVDPPAKQQQQQEFVCHSAPAGAGSEANLQQQQGGVGMLQLLQQPAVVSFLWKCLLMGFGLGVMGTYEFLWLKQLGAPETLMGMALLVRGLCASCRDVMCQCYFTLFRTHEANLASADAPAAAC